MELFQKSDNGVVVNFGKYRGQLIKSLPTDYIQWMVKNINGAASVGKAELQRRSQREQAKAPTSNTETKLVKTDEGYRLGFGKYKTYLLSQVPPEYLQWIAETMPELQSPVRQELQRRKLASQSPKATPGPSSKFEQTDQGYRILFGRYSGSLLRDIPVGYLHWLADQETGIAPAVRRELQRRRPEDPVYEGDGEWIVNVGHMKGQLLRMQRNDDLRWLGQNFAKARPIVMAELERRQQRKPIYYDEHGRETDPATADFAWRDRYIGADDYELEFDLRGWEPVPVDWEVPRLAISLTPIAGFGTTLRKLLDEEQHKHLKRAVHEPNGWRCTICNGQGTDWPVELYAIWDYDLNDEPMQVLVDVISLCPACRQAKNYEHSRGNGLEEDVQRHVKRVNGWENDEPLREHLKRTYTRFKTIFDIEWGLDVSLLSERFGITIPQKRLEAERLRRKQSFEAYARKMPVSEGRTQLELEQNVRDYPRNPHAWFQLAEWHYDRNEIEPAFHPLMRSIELDPEQEQVWFMLGELYWAGGQYERALDTYRHHVEQNPLDGHGWAKLGVVYYSMGQIDDAEEAFEKGRTLQPDDPMILAFSAELAFLKGRLGPCVQYIDSVLQYDLEPIYVAQFALMRWLCNPESSWQGVWDRFAALEKGDCEAVDVTAMREALEERRQPHTDIALSFIAFLEEKIDKRALMHQIGMAQQ